MIDIRPIGLTCQTVSDLPEEQKFSFPPTDIDAVERTDDMFDGRNMSKLIVRLKGGRRFEYWLDKQLQNAVARAQISSPEFTSSAEVTVVETQTVSGHLLPRTIVYKRIDNGQVVAEETTGMKVLSIDEEINPSVFRLIGLGLTWGILVQDKAKAATGAADRGIQMWDGKKLVPRL